MTDAPPNLITFGCRLNACESDTIEEFARDLGLANYTIINTCAVTAEAERKLRQAIRKLHNEDKDVKIILTGCASELNPDYYVNMDGVVGIISNKFKLSRGEYSKYSDASPSRESNSPPKKVRGFLQIQNGCDQKCTYCVVRLTRGPNISFDRDEIVAQAKKLLRKGYREIVLTGVNISSYGRENERSCGNLSCIIRYILKNVPEITRLRLSSLDPADMDSELINVIAGEERLLPHIHESIQSGDDMILKRMLRRHSSHRVIEINSRILERRPDVVFGADIIVGFPTETDEMFFNTKKILKEAKISLVHSFPFSRRPGTPAASMPMVDKKTVSNRIQELKTLSQEILSGKLSEFVGKNTVVFAESSENAKTNSFLPVKSTEKLVSGQEYLFQCTSFDKNKIIGKPIQKI